MALLKSILHEYVQARARHSNCLNLPIDMLIDYGIYFSHHINWNRMHDDFRIVVNFERENDDSILCVGEHVQFQAHAVPTVALID